MLRNMDYKVIDAIAFGLGDSDLKVNQKVDVAYSLVEDQWHWDKRVQLKVKDIRLSEKN